MPKVEKKIPTTVSEKEARAKRLRTLRSMLLLSRQAAAESLKINVGTLQSWEESRGSGLTMKGAERVVKAVKQLGVNCDIKWLLYGTNPGPQIDLAAKQATKTEFAPLESNESLVLEELMLFRKHVPDSLDLILEDDAMLPYFAKGDYVAGKLYSLSNIKELLGHPCIVITEETSKILRLVKPGKKTDTVNLVCTNLDTTKTSLVLENIKPINIAPVIWHRKINLNSQDH
jgi:DNA-binding transcriptional regulator YiaG